MDAIANPSPEVAAAAASPANVPTQTALAATPKSSFGDCLQSALQNQGAAAPKDASNTDSSSANSQSSSATDCTSSSPNPQSTTQSGSHNMNFARALTTFSKPSARTTLKISKEGPAHKQSETVTKAAVAGDSSAIAVPVQLPLIPIPANVTLAESSKAALPGLVAVAPGPATLPTSVPAFVETETTDSPTVPTPGPALSLTNSPNISEASIGGNPAMQKQGSEYSQPGAPAVVKSMIAQQISDSSIPAVSAKGLNPSPSGQVLASGEAAIEPSARRDIPQSPQFLSSTTSPAAATALDSGIGKSDGVVAPAAEPMESMAPIFSDSKGAPKHSEKPGSDSGPAENLTQLIPLANVDRKSEPQIPETLIHATEKQVATDAPAISLSAVHDPSMQAMQAVAIVDKTGGASVSSVSRDSLHPHGEVLPGSSHLSPVLESSTPEKDNANSDSNGGSSNASSGQPSAAVPPASSHGIPLATETNFSSHIDSALNAAATKQEMNSTASNTSSNSTLGAGSAATGSAVADRRDMEVASTSSAWDLATAHADRLVQTAQLSQSSGQAEMRIHISTEAMGSVELRTTVQQDHIAAAITVQRSDTQAALLGELPSLQLALHNRQLQIDQLDINYGGQNAGTTGQNGSNSQDGGFEKQQNSSRNWRHTDTVPVRSDTVAEPQTGLDGSRTLSVRA